MADGSTHLRPQPASIRTIIDTAHAYDAGVAGFDRPTEAGFSGGFRVMYDGRHSIPSVEIIVSDNEVCGLEAIQAMADAWMDAAKMARRQMGMV